MNFDFPPARLVDVERHADRLEADPGEKAFVEARALAHRQKRVDRLPVKETEVACAGRQPHVAKFLQQAIEDAGKSDAQFWIGRAIDALAIDVLVSFSPFFDELRDDFRRVLQVGVHDHDSASAGVIETGGDRNLLAEIARKRQGVKARLLGAKVAQNVQALVGRPVIDKNSLVGDVAGVEGGLYSGRQRPKILRFVKKRDDKRDVWAVHGWVKPIFNGAA